MPLNDPERKPIADERLDELIRGALRKIDPATPPPSFEDVWERYVRRSRNPLRRLATWLLRVLKGGRR